MKMTMTDGTVFEGSMAEYEALLAFAERKVAEESAVKAESKPRPFAEGDIVVITANTNDSCNTVGDIGKISEYVADEDSHRVLVSGNGNLGNWTLESEMRHATAEEIAQYESSLADASKPKLKAGDFVKITRKRSWYIPDKIYEVITDEDGELAVIDDDGDENGAALRSGEYTIVDADDAKWAKIGRKPGEYKVGDVVRITANNYEHKVGELRTIKAFGGAGFDFRFVNGGLSTYENIELVAPVESLFNA